MADPCLTWQPLTLQLRHPFALSHGVSETRQSFWLRLRDDAGWGEAAIPPYYRVDASEMIACWQRAADADRAFPDEVDEVQDWIPEGPAPARCALELALLDRIGKQRGKPLWMLFDLLCPPPTRPTCFTISIDTPDAMAQMAADSADFPLLKIKLGSDDDEARLRAIRRARFDAGLVVDANAGWTTRQAIANLPWLDECRVDCIEQPVAKDDYAGLGKIQRSTYIPIVADESVQTLEDVKKLHAAGVRAINVKLMKVGGILPALEMIERAVDLNMRIMLGCMIESSLGVTAMAHLACLANWIDLDAPVLIENDPFAGVTYDLASAGLRLPDRPGIGVVLRPEKDQRN